MKDIVAGGNRAGPLTGLKDKREWEGGNWFSLQMGQRFRYFVLNFPFLIILPRLPWLVGEYFICYKFLFLPF